MHGFAGEERDALLPYPDGVTNSKVSLPSGWLENWLQPTTRQGEITRWFGSEDGAYEAYYKKSNIPLTYPRDYWTRTPVSGYTGTDPRTANSLSAWRVRADGDISFAPVNDGDKEAYAVRPVLLLDLGALLFKAASGDFDLSSAPASGGRESNPWILVLGGLAPLDWTIAFQSADIRPQSAAIDATGKIMTVTWAGPISPAVQRWPASADFTLVRSGVRSNPTSVTSSDVDTLVLTFTNATFQGERVTLGYNLNTDAISCDVTTTPQAIEVVDSFAGLTVINNSTVPAPDPGPTPSSETRPGSVSTTVDGTKIPGELQPDGTYLITVPYGTDISNLSVDVTPPKGGSVSPDMPVSHDFTKGPLTFTVTAEDGSKKDYTIKVQVENPAGPIEKPLFTAGVADCEIVVTRNADGTLSVKVRIPFAQGSDPTQLATVRMIANSLGLSDVSYVWVDAEGSETPVARMKAKAPYLEIRGTAADMDAIKNGVITKIEYTLRGDNGLYAQTFSNGGLKIASIPGYPSPQPTPSGGSSSGCDAGAMGLVALGLFCGVYLRRRQS